MVVKNANPEGHNQYTVHGDPKMGFVTVKHGGETIGSVSQLGKNKWRAKLGDETVASAAGNHHLGVEVIKSAHKAKGVTTNACSCGGACKECSMKHNEEQDMEEENPETELEEERQGRDLDHDNEEGEPMEHRKKVLGNAKLVVNAWSDAAREAAAASRKAGASGGQHADNAVKSAEGAVSGAKAEVMTAADHHDNAAFSHGKAAQELEQQSKFGPANLHREAQQLHQKAAKMVGNRKDLKANQRRSFWRWVGEKLGVLSPTGNSTAASNPAQVSVHPQPRHPRSQRFQGQPGNAAAKGYADAHSRGDQTWEATDQGDEEEGLVEDDVRPDGRGTAKLKVTGNKKRNKTQQGDDMTATYNEHVGHFFGDKNELSGGSVGASSGARQASTTAGEKGTKGAHKEAHKAHKFAAAAHRDQAEKKEDAGDSEGAAAHRETARSHERAASMHAKKFMTKNTREENLELLTNGLGSTDDLAILNQLSDDAIRTLALNAFAEGSNAEAGPTGEVWPGGKDPLGGDADEDDLPGYKKKVKIKKVDLETNAFGRDDEDDEEDDEDEDEEYAMKRNARSTGGAMTENQLIAAMPRQWQEALAYGHENLGKAKKRLIRQLIGNRNPKHPSTQRCLARYKAMTINQLEDELGPERLAVIRAPQMVENGGLESLVAMFLGGAGADPTPVVNEATGIVEAEDNLGMPPPTINVAEERRKRKMA